MVLLRNAEIDGTRADVRIRGGVVAEFGRLAAVDGEEVVEARGGVLLPGLHDHHLHFLALAAARSSVRCGPPEVCDRDQLRAALAAAPAEKEWIRGVGYHESVAGELDRAALDAFVPERPVRIQHRSGKMWFLNGAALRSVGLDPGGDGRLFRRDEWLRKRLGDADLTAAALEVSAQLAAWGVTGFTDATPSNDAAAVRRIRELAPHQRVYAMGNETLATGHLKVMLDDAELPDIDELVGRIGEAHERGRPVAFHCVTRTELVFALGALMEAGTQPGDRIEHAAIADEDGLRLLREAGVTVVTQPNFIAERGDRYVADVEAGEHRFLYRGAGFLDAGIPLAGGTDAPFGEPDPWALVKAAVLRETQSGVVVGEGEKLTPERALALFTTPHLDPGGAPRKIGQGAPADLCLLALPWREARLRLDGCDVVGTWIAGKRSFGTSAR
ncbi:MAG: amidohydrolase family protein [Gammaproteobacteria bacterium]|nr:amidohydrolase family protein [Gammaproteobacteria bacterium]